MLCTKIELPARVPEGPATEPLIEFPFHASTPSAPIGLELLHGPDSEVWCVAGPVNSRVDGQIVIREAPDYLFAQVAVTVEGDPVDQTRTIYSQLVSTALKSGYPKLLRFWNYIPDINEGDADQERYRRFCLGRAEALAPFELPLPAASGTGAHDGVLRISMLAGKAGLTAAHHENPRQISAYRYPRQYGPKSPSFARATSLQTDAGVLLMVSGTASIVSHESRHDGDLTAQIEETRRNIAALTQPFSNLRPIACRVYLRHQEDIACAVAAYQRVFEGFPEPSVLHSDICRRELLFELELVYGR